MDARVTLSPGVREQMSTDHKILLWMLQNENRLRNTNNTQLAKAMALSGPTANCPMNTLRMRMARMIDNQIIYRYGGKRRAQFRINYLHKDIPPDVIDQAPKSVQLEVKRTLRGVTEGKYLDDVGCIVTPPAPKPEEPKAEDQSTPAKEVSDTSTEINNELTVPVKVTKDGKTLNITININLSI